MIKEGHFYLTKHGAIWEIRRLSPTGNSVYITNVITGERTNYTYHWASHAIDKDLGTNRKTFEVLYGVSK